ncbi:hypothetical protein LDENG_00237260, partial [Lucifuga dentata]
PKNVSSINKLILIAYQNKLKPTVVWKVGKTFLILCSSSMLWEMIVSNIMLEKLNILGSNMQNSQYGPLRLNWVFVCFSVK